MVRDERLWRHAVRIWGLQTDFLNAKKELVKIPLKHLQKVFHGATEHKFATATLEEIIDAGRERKILGVLNPVIVVKNGRIASTLFLPSSENSLSVKMSIRKESGEVVDITPRYQRAKKTYIISCGDYARWNFEFYYHLEVGYHALEVTVLGKKMECLLLVPPGKKKASDPRLLGIFSPLYALHSSQSWGIGDLRDLYELQQESAKWGVDFVGTLPLLATVYEGPHKDLSPYAPSSKLFWNEIYLFIPEILKKDISPELQEEIFKLNSLDWVDYESVFRLKKNILSQMALEFFKKELPPEYIDFIEERPLVERYARYRGEDSESEYQYHLFVQFHMHQQMKDIGKNLYLDYPIGVHSQGFDTAYFSEYFLKKMSVGAPPDIMFTHGQNWGFAPLHPFKLREKFYSYFIQTLRHHMKNSSILRLDHVMGLHRLYIIPENCEATCGTYLRYNGEELFAIVNIEATRNNVKVVGENLGTVPATVQDYLQRYDTLGMWIMAFDGGKWPVEAIQNIPPKNLAAFSTHDMLPFAGYLKANDISAWKRDFFDRSPSALMAKMLSKLAQSPAEIFLLNIEDLWLEEKPQNIPGPSVYPNWQKKLKYPLERWSRNEDITAFIGHLSELRNERRFHEHLIEIRRSLSLQ